jgi:hypothetical protein
MAGWHFFVADPKKTRLIEFGRHRRTNPKVKLSYLSNLHFRLDGAALPLPVLHGRVSLTDVVVDTIRVCVLRASQGQPG